MSVFLDQWYLSSPLETSFIYCGSTKTPLRLSISDFIKLRANPFLCPELNTLRSSDQHGTVKVN